MRLSRGRLDEKKKSAAACLLTGMGADDETAAATDRKINSADFCWVIVLPCFIVSAHYFTRA